MEGDPLHNFIVYFEKKYEQLLAEDKYELDHSDDISTTFIKKLEESINNGESNKTIWLFFRYGAPNNFELIMEWINYGLAHSSSISRTDNLGESQETLIKFLLEKKLISEVDINKLIKKLRRREVGGYSDKPRKLLELVLQEISNEAQKENSKLDLLHSNLFQHNFADLPKVKCLNPQSRRKLIELINDNDAAYAVAMMNFLGFIDYLDGHFFQSKTERNKKLANWLNVAKSGRSIKGNISVLNPRSDENKKRYTAHIHTVTVTNDYEKLK
jgi:hypothetical protein